jgi:uncharacterized protein
MQRRFLRANFVLALGIVVCAGAVKAEQVKELKPSGFVNDFANVIDSESARQLEYLCSQVDRRAQAQIAVVTIQNLEGSTIETFATRLFRQWGIGPKSNNRGVLILLAVRDHKYRIEVGTGLEGVITARKAAGFGREAVPYLKEFKYGRALQVITRRVTDAIAGDAQITVGNAPAPTPVPAASFNESSSSSGSNLGAAFGGMIIAVVVIGLIIWLLIVAARSGYSGPSYGYGYGGAVYNNVGGYYNHSNTYLINGFGGSSSSSSSSSSSWGGGGGFGGGGDSSSFGGGSSSGGGSSGDWSSSSSSDSSSSDSSSSSSSDFGGGSSEGSGASGSW